MTTIRVATELLQAKEARMRGLSVDFGIAIQRRFNAGPVDEAYRRVHDRWNESQSELISGVDNIANILKAIREAFEGLDAELAAGLAGGNAPGSAGAP